jgi:hypothetical protein
VQARSSLTLERDGRVVTLPEVSSQEQKIMLLPRSLPVSADIEFIPVSNNVVYQSSKNVEVFLRNNLYIPSQLSFHIVTTIPQQEFPLSVAFSF